MRKKRIWLGGLLIVLIFVGYFAFFKDDAGEDHAFSKGINMFKYKAAQESEEAEAKMAEEASETVSGCETVLKSLEMEPEDASCVEKILPYRKVNASVVYMEGAEKENMIVFSDGRIAPLYTNIYFDAVKAVKDYVLDKDGLNISDDDIKNAKEELKIGKRGYLYSLEFKSPYRGTIYSTPKGRLSGHLKE